MPPREEEEEEEKMISHPFAEPHSTHGDRRTTWINRSGGREVIAHAYSRFDQH
jgi:hypothetical protein